MENNLKETLLQRKEQLEQVKIRIQEREKQSMRYLAVERKLLLNTVMRGDYAQNVLAKKRPGLSPGYISMVFIELENKVAKNLSTVFYVQKRLARVDLELQNIDSQLEILSSL
jgi:hypothetical protein